MAGIRWRKVIRWGGCVITINIEISLPTGGIGQIGHNGGPEIQSSQSWVVHSWRVAHAEAWKTPSIEIVRMRCARARNLGLGYREYTSVIMDRGRHLQAAVIILDGLDFAGNGGVLKKLSALKCPVLIIANDPLGQLKKLCPNAINIISGDRITRDPMALRNTLAHHGIHPLEAFLVGSREQDRTYAQAAGLAKFIRAQTYFST